LLKVFLLPANHLARGGCDGYLVLVAAPSIGAARMAGRRHGFTFSRTDSGLPPDAADVELALAHPGEPYWRPNDGSGSPWRPGRAGRYVTAPTRPAGEAR